METSKVKSITGTKKRAGTNGDVFYHSLEMENGDKVNVGKKTDNFFKVGDEIKYEVVSTDERGVKKIKEIKDSPFGAKPSFQKNYIKDSVSMALSYSKDLVCAGKVEIKDIETVAEKLHLWMSAKYLDLK